LRHFVALFDETGSTIGFAQLFIGDVSQVFLDHSPVPPQSFPDECSRHRLEAVAGNVHLGVIAQGA